MTAIKQGLLPVMEWFPDQKDTIKRLFTESESFQDLCEDFMRCREALRYWNQVESREAPTRREEYMALLRDLEEEILQRLSESG